MILKSGMYFEIDHETQYFEETIRIWIFHGGCVRIQRNRNQLKDWRDYDYKSLQEFCDAQPLVAKEIIDWSRSAGRNLDDLVSPKGTDIVPVTKQCSRCANVFPITRFPIKELAFDKAHDDCCNCRIAECERIHAYCEAPPRVGCFSCPVRKPTKEEKSS